MNRKKTVTPHDLFFDQVRDLYSVESQLCDAMPRLVVLASDAALRAVILDHIVETTAQFTELLCIFDDHGLDPGTDESQAMAGLIEGGESHLEGVDDEVTRDLMMIAHCLRIEFYEIAAYEITLRLATKLGMQNEAKILKQLLAQEKRMAAALLELEPAIFERAAIAHENVS
jgi:ferritin-like metal-binding protein YciE